MRVRLGAIESPLGLGALWEIFMSRNLVLAAMVLAVFRATCSAQTDAPVGAMPKDLAKLPDAIKNLPWQSIDPSKATPLEQAQALLILNHVLEELCPVRASEASLLSSYIQ